MPGQPKMRALTQKIDELERGEDEIFERIADGEFMGKIAQSLGVSRPMLYYWIKKGGEERQEKFDTAKQISADTLVEDGMEILDSPLDFGDHSGEPALRKARAAYRQWLASKRNRKDYGDDKQPGVNVHLSVGELHLDALRRHGTPQRVKAIEEHEVLPATVVEEG